ncbi:hypothetical protein PUV47_08845 [Pseudovibrio exalbescens]|uniref:hypothetical protein n=1 Tax=Pseudovibrio exalbescens TaxID=197461 RepID=UPI002365C971|nr:hypothetical protein [Pseudovibrio exalbescens]MDD7910024.1 hypothetical protein [Pseudovibrio exalbescens]
MDPYGARLSFSFTNLAGNYDPAPIKTQRATSVALINEVLENTANNEIIRARAAHENAGPSTASKEAVSKIFDILVGVELGKSAHYAGQIAEGLKNFDIAVERFFNVAEDWTDPNSAAVQDEVARMLTEGAEAGSELFKEMLEAQKAGLLKIEDMADYGLETKSNYITYIDGFGGYAFGLSNISYVGDYFNAHDLFNDLTVAGADGRRTDKYTGQQATYLSLAKNLNFYITWQLPEEAPEQ